MSPSEGSLINELDEKSFKNVVKFVCDVRSGKVQGSLAAALAALNLVEQIISDSESTSAQALYCALRAVGRHVTSALPAELCAANMVRRALRAVRDEQRANANQSAEGAGASLQRLVLAAPSRRATLGPATDLREPVRDHLAELRAELETSHEVISAQARDHVHAGDVVLTYGASALLEAFLRRVGGGYRLVLAENTDVRESHAMARRLSLAGVQVTVVTAAAVGALMTRVNKVVVEAAATLAGGAVLARAGLGLVTAAAAHCAVPVLVLSPLYKLAPLQAYEQHQFAPAPPHVALPYEALPYEPVPRRVGSAVSAEVRVLAPAFDLLPPDQVTLFITNLGGSSPSYVYRLMSELYDPADHSL